MKLKELIPADGIVEMNADPEQEITGISYDSRRTEPGDLFVAIRGFETDGHRYIAKAAEMGAFGRKRVQNELSWDYEKPKLISAYKKLLGL